MDNQNQKTNEKIIYQPNKRNYGLDLLRLTAGFYVIVLHTLGQGGILDFVPEGTLSFKIVWFFEILAYCAVDVFILISGFTSYPAKKRTDWTKILVLWLEVLFYSLVIFIIIKLIRHEKVLTRDLIRMFFPILNHKEYWFFASYLCLFLFKPILDKAIEQAEEKYLKIFFILVISIFSIYSIIRDPFYLILGSSPFWFLILYTLGAACKKCKIGDGLSILLLCIEMGAMIFITWIFKCYGPTFYIFNERIHDKTLINYTSPTIICIAISHLLIFARINVPDRLIKYIKFTAPSVFAIYLINTHPLYWNHYLYNKFASLAPRRISVLFPQLFLYSISFFIFSIIFDKFRQLLFRKLKIGDKNEIKKNCSKTS